MEGTEKHVTDNDEASSRRSYWWWVVGIGCLAVVLLGILLPRGDHSKSGQSNLTNQVAGNAIGSSGNSTAVRSRSYHGHGGPTVSAEEIVATKLIQIGKNRHEVLRGLAKRYNVEVRP